MIRDSVLFLSALLVILVLLAIGATSERTRRYLEPLPAPPVPRENPMSIEKVELGKRLFFDRRLSGDGTTSCASCHDPEKAFTDGSEVSLSYPTTRNFRNAPTVMNVAYARYLFWDGRAS